MSRVVILDFFCPLITRMNANEGESFAQSVRRVPESAGVLASLFVPVLGSIQNDSRRRVAFPKLREIEQKFLFLFACIRVIRGQFFGCPNAFGALWSVILSSLLRMTIRVNSRSGYYVCES